MPSDCFSQPVAKCPLGTYDVTHPILWDILFIFKNVTICLLVTFSHLVVKCLVGTFPIMCKVFETGSLVLHCHPPPVGSQTSRLKIIPVFWVLVDTRYILHISPGNSFWGKSISVHGSCTTVIMLLEKFVIWLESAEEQTGCNSFLGGA